MIDERKVRYSPLPLVAALAGLLGLGIFGCGGGGGSSSSPTTATTATTSTTSGGVTAGSDHPTAKTTSDITQHLAGYGQAYPVTEFKGFGPGISHIGSAVFNPQLGLYGVAGIFGDHITKNFYVDQAKTETAGLLAYSAVEGTSSVSGSISITKGRYAGLTGTYNHNLEQGSPGGYNGSIVYTTPNVSTVDSQFNIVIDADAAETGSINNAVAFDSGYTQTEKMNLIEDGSMVATTSDSNSCSSSFNFAADLSGTGKITGKDPGLPASVTWDDTGTGSLTYADGSSVAFTNWAIAGK